MNSTVAEHVAKLRYLYSVVVLILYRYLWEKKKIKVGNNENNISVLSCSAGKPLSGTN